jgi:hypothetical protein
MEEWLAIFQRLKVMNQAPIIIKMERYQVTWPTNQNQNEKLLIKDEDLIQK